MRKSAEPYIKGRAIHSGTHAARREHYNGDASFESSSPFGCRFKPHPHNWGGEETAPVSGCALSSGENTSPSIAENRRRLSCTTTRRVFRANFGDERKRCVRAAAADVGFTVRGLG